MPRSEVTPRLTLFDSRTYSIHPMLNKDAEYTLGFERLYNSDDPAFYDYELVVFDDVARSEAALVEGKTLISGPLIADYHGRRIDFSKVRTPVEITGWIESPRLMFKKCTARGILFIEKATHFYCLYKDRAWYEHGLLLMTGNGIPRVGTRRILHRLSEEFGLPVYVLADNDTWGYFLFSVLKRGALTPHKRYPELAIKDVRFVGLRAGDLFDLRPDEILIRWKPRWNKRLRAMERYSCFRSAAWKKEFNAFRRQRGKIELDSMGAKLMSRHSNGSQVRRMAEVMREIIIGRIERREWLA